MALSIGRIFLGVTLFAVATAAHVPSAVAIGDPYDGQDYAYAGAGWQFGLWHQLNRDIRLVSHASVNMSTDKCMDAMVDWKVDQPLIGHNHYDSRIVRDCRPGTEESTDPGGNGSWREPSDWSGETPEGLQRGFGYMIDDDTLAVVERERFADSGSLNMGNYAPKTYGQGGARVRTLYQDGHVVSCNPLPENDPDWHGCS